MAVKAKCEAATLHTAQLHDQDERGSWASTVQDCFHLTSHQLVRVAYNLSLDDIRQRRVLGVKVGL